MAKIVKAPQEWPKGMYTIFLAGSIDQGSADDWQSEAEVALEDYDVLVLSPRRDDWDSSWTNEADFEPFAKQVAWERDGLKKADFRIFNFTRDSKAPITFGELGEHIKDPGAVACPEGFYRRGNVELQCRDRGMPFFATLEDLLTNLKTALDRRGLRKGPGKKSRLLQRSAKTSANATDKMTLEAGDMGTSDDNEPATDVSPESTNPALDAATDITSQPAFKAWFRDSKVVDAEGKPLVVYHGTSADFDAFDTEMDELGSHFGAREHANARAGLQAEVGANVRPCYVSIQNPLRLVDHGGFHAAEIAGQLCDAGVIPEEEMWQFVEDEEEYDSTQIKPKIIAAGYDGIVYLNRGEGLEDTDVSDLGGASDEEFRAALPQAKDSWIAFHPNQIKSAIGNSGNFDSENHSITASSLSPYEAKMERLVAFLHDFWAQTSSNPENDKEQIWRDSVGIEARIFWQRIHIGAIRSLAEGQGNASAALGFLTGLADKHHVELEVIPVPFGGRRLDQTQLREWYIRHGFKKDPDGYVYFPMREDKSEGVENHSITSSLTPTQEEMIEVARPYAGVYAFAQDPEAFDWKYDPHLELSRIHNTSSDADDETPVDRAGQDTENYTEEYRNQLISAIKEGTVDPIIATVFGDKLLTWDGHHRIALAISLGVKALPAYVGYRKKDKPTPPPSRPSEDLFGDDDFLDLTDNQRIAAAVASLESTPTMTPGDHTVRIGDAKLEYKVVPAAKLVELYSLRVVQRARRKGQARAAMVAFVAAVDEVGYKATLIASALDKKTVTEGLIRFYESVGFRQTGEKANLAGDPCMEHLPKGKSEKGITASLETAFEKAEAYPRAGSEVSGLHVVDDIPNTGSISASFNDYEVLKGVREIPMSAFPFTKPTDLFYSSSDIRRTEALAEQIRGSGWIAPLIVAIDKDGPYILEGIHRLGALDILGAASLPAMVVLDLDGVDAEPDNHSVTASVTSNGLVDWREPREGLTLSLSDLEKGDWAAAENIRSLFYLLGVDSKSVSMDLQVPIRWRDAGSAWEELNHEGTEVEKKVRAIAALMHEGTKFAPAVLHRGHWMDGNHRIKAASSIGCSDIPFINLWDFSPNKRKEISNEDLLQELQEPDKTAAVEQAQPDFIAIANQARKSVIGDRAAVDGDCQPVTEEMYDLLTKQGFRPAMVAGEFDGRSHTWLTLNNTLVDATFDQFGGDEVLVLPVAEADNEGYEANHSYSWPVTASRKCAACESGDCFPHTAADEPDTEPAKDGPFGPIFSEFAGKPKEAITKLQEERTGEVPAVWVHPELGPIDLVWGVPGDSSKNYRGGFGLAHIIAKHVSGQGDITLEHLSEAIPHMTVVWNDGHAAKLADEAHNAGVNLEWFGEAKTWLITAYGRDERNKRSSVRGYLGVPSSLRISSQVSSHPLPHDLSAIVPQNQMDPGFQAWLEGDVAEYTTPNALPNAK